MMKKIIVFGLLLLLFAFFVQADNRILPQTTVTNDSWTEIFTYSTTDSIDVGGVTFGIGIFKLEYSMLRLGSGSSAYENITNIEFVCYDGTFINSSGTNILELQNFNHTNTPIVLLQKTFLDFSTGSPTGCRFSASFNGTPIIADSPPWTTRSSFAGFKNDFVCEEQIFSVKQDQQTKINIIQGFVMDFIELNFQIILILFWIFVITIFLAILSGVALIGIFLYRMIKGTGE